MRPSSIVLSARVLAHGPHGPSVAQLASLDNGTLYLWGQAALKDALKETQDAHAAELGKATKEAANAKAELETAHAKAASDKIVAWVVAFVFAWFAVLAGAFHINPRT